MDSIHIAGNIERLRQQKGWSSAELGRRAKVSPAYTWHLEQGTFHNPGIQVLLRLARALGVSVVELLTGPDYGRD